MTETIEIINKLKKNKSVGLVFKFILFKECTYDELLMITEYKSEKLQAALNYIDSVGIIHNVFTKNKKYYRVGERGKKIAKIIGLI